jgi:hypothetical protein
MLDCLLGLALTDREVTQAGMSVGTALLIGFLRESEEAFPR